MNTLLVYLIGCLMALVISIYYLVMAYRDGSIKLGQLTVSFLIVLFSYLGAFVAITSYIYDHWYDDVIVKKNKK